MNLHLLIAATKKLQVTIRQVAGQVTGFVEACLWDTAEGMRDEALSSEFGMIDIPSREANPTNEQFTWDSERYRVPISIDEVHFIATDHRTNRCASVQLQCRMEGKQGCTDSGLGWSIPVHNVHLLREITKTLQRALWNGLNTNQETPELYLSLLLLKVAGDVGQECRRDIGTGNTMVHQVADKLLGSGHDFGQDKVQCPTKTQRRATFPH